MNAAIVRASRPVKPPVFTDITVRDLQKHLGPSDDQLLRRWERITQGSHA